MSKTRASCFICFSVFGTPDETLALVFDILHQSMTLKLCSKKKNRRQYLVDHLHTQPIHAVDLNSFKWLQTTFGRNGQEIIFQVC